MGNALAVVMTASDENEAKVVQAVLQAAGIQAFTEGSALMDEWAVAQRALGKIGCEVKVAAENLEQAKQVIAEAREAGHVGDENDSDGTAS